MSEPRQDQEERNAIFVLAGLLLAAIVSIAFYNLDRHPAFSAPSDEFIAAIAQTDATVIYADDPLALTVLEERQSDLQAAIYPLTDWPPQSAVVTFGSTGARFSQASLELVAEDSVWSLWLPEEFAPVPYFGTAHVEVEDREGRLRPCVADPRGGFQCGEHTWTRLRPRTITVDGERERCIWAHPIRNRIVRIRYDDISTVTTDGRRLWLSTALRDAAVGTGQPVDFHVQVGDQTLSHRHRDRRGWQRTQLPATAESSELVIEVSAEETGRRHTCYRLDLQ